MNSKVENASLVSAHYGSRSLVSLNEAHVAQLVEHVLGKDEVTRSIRVVGSRQAGPDPEPFGAVLGCGMGCVSVFI